MTFVVALFALAIGWTAGTIFGTRHAEELHQENDRLRTALRYVRGAAIRHPELGRLRGYIDRALDDEGAA